jgi:hypothetical protein
MSDELEKVRSKFVANGWIEAVGDNEFKRERLTSHAEEGIRDHGINFARLIIEHPNGYVTGSAFFECVV